MIAIREEEPRDAAQVRVVNELAFGRTTEADIVDALRAACAADSVSLVAADDGALIGHVLFTPATVEAGARSVTGMGLAPLAVLPDRQGGGVGSELVRRGLELLQARRCPFVIVLGHPEYYPRFGFEPASARGLASQWEGVPGDAFMVLVLDEAAMDGVSGVARYRSEFDDAV